MAKKEYKQLLKEAIAEFDTSKTVEVKGPMLDPILKYEGGGELPTNKDASGIYDAASILERYYFNENRDEMVEEMEYNDDGTDNKGPTSKHSVGAGTEQAGTDEKGMDKNKEEIAKEGFLCAHCGTLTEGENVQECSHCGCRDKKAKKVKKEQDEEMSDAEMEKEMDKAAKDEMKEAEGYGKDEEKEEEMEESESIEEAVLEKLISEMEDEEEEEMEEAETMAGKKDFTGVAPDQRMPDEEKVAPEDTFQSKKGAVKEETMAGKKDFKGVEKGQQMPPEKEMKDTEQHAMGAGTPQAGTGDAEGQVPDRKDMADDMVKPKQYTNEQDEAGEEEAGDEKELDVDKKMEEGEDLAETPLIHIAKGGEDKSEYPEDLKEAFELFTEQIEDEEEDEEKEED